MSNHRIRKEKWENIQHNLERSAELLIEVQELASELREDYSYSASAEERRETLSEIDDGVGEALKAIENVLDILE